MKLMATALAAAFLLAGCSSGTDDPTTPQTGGDPTTGPSTTTTGGRTTGSATTGTMTPTGTGGGGGGGDPVPTMSFSASVASGSLPLAVNFTLDGKDPEGESLSWTVDLADGSAPLSGTTLPTTFRHTYTAAGNYTVRATVSDGSNDVNKTVLVKALSNVAPSQSVSATWQVATPFVGCLSDFILEDPNYPSDLDGVAYASFPIDATTIGLPFSWEITTGTEMDSPGLTMLDAAGAIVFNSVSAGEDAALIVPTGAATGYFYACAGADFTGSYNAGAAVTPA